MATIGKRINGNSERPSRFGLIYVEGEQDLNIKLVGSIDLGDSPFSSQAATKYNESYSGIYAPDSNITIIGDGTFSALFAPCFIRCYLFFTYPYAIFCDRKCVQWCNGHYHT